MWSSTDAKFQAYFDSYCAVTDADIKSPKTSLNNFKFDFDDYIQSDNSLRKQIGSLEYRGSTEEGLKIKPADTFDMVLPIKVTGVEPQVITSETKDGRKVPGEFVCLVRSVESTTCSETDFEPFPFNVEAMFSPGSAGVSFDHAKVKKGVRALLERMTKGMKSGNDSYSYKVTEDKFGFRLEFKGFAGAAPTEVEIYFHVRGPSGKGYVSRSPGKEFDVNHDLCWRESFGHKEEQLWKKVNPHSKLRKALLIAKALRQGKTHAPLALLPSYIYKTAAMRLTKSSSSITSSSTLDDVVKLLLTMIRDSARDRRLCCFWMTDVNLLDKYSGKQLAQVQSYLTKHLEKGVGSLL